MGEVQIAGGTPDEWFRRREQLRDSLSAKLAELKEQGANRLAEAHARLGSQPRRFRRQVEAALPNPEECTDPSSLRSWNELANDPAEKLLDSRLALVCAVYAGSNPEQRLLIRDLIGERLARSLLLFAWRSAVRALRTQSSDVVKRGLIALSIEDRRTDFRDTIRFLGLLYHVARMLRIDVPTAFREAGMLSSSETQRLFLSDPYVPPTARDRLERLGVRADPKHSTEDLETMILDLGETPTPPTFEATIESCGFRVTQNANGPRIELSF